VTNRLAGGQLAAMRKRLTARASSTASLLLIGTAAAALAGCAGSAGASSAADQAALAASRTPHTASLAATGRKQATLAVVSGAATISVTTAAMPGKLLRVLTPADSGIRPELVESAGRVQLFLGGGDGAGGGPSAVAIQLSSAETWQLQFSGGASETILNLGNGKVSAIDFTAGSSLIQMRLPRPAGTATITLAGGASQVSMTTPAGVPSRLQLDGGASTAMLGGVTHIGIAGGTVLTGPGWAQAASRYDVLAPAGVSDISVFG
jgi:hypothetical protein